MMLTMMNGTQLLANNNETLGVNHNATPGADDEHDDAAGAFNWSFISVLMFVVAGTLGNVLVCLAVCLERPLQNVTNWFLVSLAFADLIVSTIVMPFGATAGFLGYWPLGVTWCNVYVTCDVLACSASILHMCCISLGRYLGIRSPLRARGYGGRSGAGSSFLTGSSKRHVITRVVLVWLLALLISSPISALGLLDPANIMSGDQCVINNRGFAFAASLAAFYVPMIIMVVSYALTVHLLRNKARQHQQQMLYRVNGGGSRGSSTTNRWTSRSRSFSVNNFNNSSAAAGQDHDRMMVMDDVAGQHQERGTQTPSSVSRERKRLIWRARFGLSSVISSFGSRGGADDHESVVRIVSANKIASTAAGRCRKMDSVTSRRRSFSLIPASSHNISSAATVANEQKASKVLGVVFFTFVLCWAPFFLLNLLMAVWPSSAGHIPDRLVATCLWLGYVSSTINPLIYTVFNRTFKRVFIRLLKCKCKKSPVVPASASANNVVVAGSVGTPGRYGRCSSVYEGLTVHNGPNITPSLSRYR